MDAVNFVKNYIQICATVDDCEQCPCYKTNFCTAPAKKWGQEEAEEIVRIVEGWSTEHPLKTRQDIFLEHYPEAPISNNGILNICPGSVSAEHRDVYGGCSPIYSSQGSCEECRQEYWMQEI